MKVSDHRTQLTTDQWRFLLRQTTLYATFHLNRWHWRGSLGGILASQAIADFLRHKLPLPLPGWGEGERSSSLSLRQIQRDLERRVRRIINRLHHRSENRLLRNEPDLGPVTLDDGEPTSIINLIPEPSDNPGHTLLSKESQDRFDRARFLFHGCLGRDLRLHQLFSLYCDGRSKPRDLATALNTKPRTVKNLRRRFLRKWNHFHSLLPGFSGL